MMDARRNQVYTGLYEFVSKDRDSVLQTILPQCAEDVTAVLDKINTLGREVIFLGDGVPVYKSIIESGTKVPFAYAPAGRNRQRAANIAALGSIYYSQGRTVSAADHQPEYIRKGQAGAEQKDFTKNVL
jgi:tRNA threonylcarbamoyladenosine biosynthesis protein TsaB